MLPPARNELVSSITVTVWDLPTRTLVSVSAIIASTPLQRSFSFLNSAANALMRVLLLARPLLSTRVDAGESDIAECVVRGGRGWRREGRGGAGQRRRRCLDQEGEKGEVE